MQSARPVRWIRMQAFDSWDCTPPVLPPRSWLYALAPIGIGTPFVESLSGYVARLAEAHAVSVGDLVGRELSPSVSTPLISFGRSMRQSRADSHGFHARAHAINGFGTGNLAGAICGRSPTRKGSVSASIFEGFWSSPWLRSGPFRPIESQPASDTPTMDTCGASFRICAARLQRKSRRNRQSGSPTWKGFSQKP